MIINTTFIQQFNPCKDRINNYINYYDNKDFTLTEFLKLDNITYDDKIWVWKRFATINEAALFGLKCAESVLYLFENKYPSDKRPRLALESVKIYIDNPTQENKLNCRAYAVYTAYAAATNAAAYAAYAAAAYAANAAADVAYAAAAYAANAAAYAANAANAANANKQAQQEKNLQFLIEIYEGK